MVINMKTKKIICIVVAMAMLCLVAACVSETNSGGSGGGSSSSGSEGSGGSGGSNSGGSGNSGSGGNNSSDGSNSGGSGNSGSGGSDGGSGSGGDTQVQFPGDGEDGEDGDNGDGEDGEDGGDSGTGGGGGDSGNSGGGSSGGDSSLSGTASEVLGALVEDLKNSGVDMPMTFPGPPPEVSPELAHNYIGLSEDDFTRLVVSAAFSEAAIGTFAHLISIIQAKDAAAAGEVKRLISGSDGFDPQKWICVWPEMAAAVDSGSYVLLVAARIVVVEAAIDIFGDTGGSLGEVVTFWEFAGE